MASEHKNSAHKHTQLIVKTTKLNTVNNKLITNDMTMSIKNNNLVIETNELTTYNYQPRRSAFVAHSSRQAQQEVYS